MFLMKNKYCIEVKNYSESPLTDKIFTAPRTNNLIRWWNKLKYNKQLRGTKKPYFSLSIIDHLYFVVTADKPKNFSLWIDINFLGCYVMVADEWLKNEKPEFLNGV